jgi:predicted house-cleaning NTP pyrophosphatase (Maf/HAM1 superfamily)
MNDLTSPGRRALLQRAALGLSLAPWALDAAPAAPTASLPLISEQDPAAKAVQYVEDASRSKAAAASGANCSNCSLYSAASGAAQGSCTLFPGKLVKAAGWCSSWSGL